MMRRGLIGLIVLGGICAVSTQVLAQQPADEGGVAQKVVSASRYIPTSSLEHQSGKIGIVESGIVYSYEARLREKLPVKFSLGTRYIGIENSSAIDLPARLAGTTFDAETTLPFFWLDSMYVRLGITPSLLGDSWDYSWSDFRVPFRSVLAYKPSEIWTFVAGIAVFPEFDREVVPVFGLIYKPGGAWLFDLTAPRPHIDYVISRRWTVFAEGGLYSNEYEVDHNGIKTAVLCYQEYNAGFGARYRLSDAVSATVSAGRVFDRVIEYRDDSGKVVIKGDCYIDVRLEARF